MIHNDVTVPCCTHCSAEKALLKNPTIKHYCKCNSEVLLYLIKSERSEPICEVLHQELLWSKSSASPSTGPRRQQPRSCSRLTACPWFVCNVTFVRLHLPSAFWVSALQRTNPCGSSHQLTGVVHGGVSSDYHKLKPRQRQHFGFWERGGGRL